MQRILLLGLTLLFYVSVQAASVEDCNPALISYLKSCDPTTKTDLDMETRARGWDESIMTKDVLKGYKESSSNMGPLAPYQAVVNKYADDRYDIVTRQTRCVWFAEITARLPVSEFKDLILEVFNLPKNVVLEADTDKKETEILIDQVLTNAKVLRLSNLPANPVKEYPGEIDWPNRVRILTDGKKIYVWTLKYTGYPSARVLGYSDHLNKMWR